MKAFTGVLLAAAGLLLGAALLSTALRRFTNRFYGQNGQDQWVRDHLLWEGADGFFVEFGARDGITHSNTAYFERTLGWKGLCIEPLAVEFKALRVNRPNCRCVNGAIGTRRGLQDFVIVEGKLGWNGFWEEMAPSRQRDLVKKNASGAVRLRTIKTQTYPLADLLRAAQPTADVLHASLLSIDTEGSELSVLRSLDWGRFRADVVQVEKSQHEKAIDRLMRKHGFVVRTDAQLQDSIYVRRAFVPSERPWWSVRCLPHC